MKNQGSYTSSAMKASSAISSSNPAAALLAGLSSMLTYIRYMKVNYPSKVQVLFLMSADNPIMLGFDFNIPTFIGKRLIDYSLPDCFDKYDINSNFLNNMWDFLMTLMLMFMVIFAVMILEATTKKFKKLNTVIRKTLQMLKWNAPLAMICSSSGDIFFYSSLQFMSSPLNTMSSVVCFIICLIMMVSVIALFILTLKIMKSFYLSRRQHNQEGENWKKKFTNCEILYAEYEEKTVLSVGYMALFILRGTIFNLTIATLYNFPFIQSIIINVANLSMFGYIIYLRPLKELLGVAQLFITEGVVSTVSVCVLILAILDKANIEGVSTRRQVGDVMAFLIQAFNTLALVFLGIGILLFLIFTFRIWRLLRSQGIKSPLEILEKILLSGLDVETVKAAAISNPLVNILVRKPKIRRPPRRDQPVVANPGLNTAPVIYLESLNNSMANFPVERSRKQTEENFLESRPSPMKLQLPLPSQMGEELDSTNFFSNQTVLFEQESRENQERSFQGLNETVGEGDFSQNTEGNILEIRAVKENIDEVKIGSPHSRRINVVEDWNQLKTRVKRFTNFEMKICGIEREDKQRYDQLKKLKIKLQRRLEKPEINIENQE